MPADITNQSKRRRLREARLMMQRLREAQLAQIAQLRRALAPDERPAVH